MTEWIVSSSVLILVVVLLRFLLRGKIRLKLQYGLWALVLARLLVPVSFGSTAISLENRLEETPVVQQFAMAEQVEHFTYHADGTATGYYTFAPVLDHTDQPVEAKPVPQQFTRQEALQITSIRSAGKWLKWIWIAGIAVMGAVFLVSNLRFFRQLRRSRQLLTRKKLPVYVTGAVDTPCLFGLFRPAIYLTSEVAEDDRHREYAIAHEQTHYTHWDMVWSALRCVALALHWYNPLVWWAAVLSREDGELACDEQTIARLGEENRAEYGRVLIDLTCRKRGDLLHTATMMTGSGKSLKERITLIAKKPKMAFYTLIAVILIAAVAVGCTFTGGKDPAADTEPTEDVQLPTALEEDGQVIMPTGVPEDEPPQNATPLTQEEMDALNARFQPVDGQANAEFQAVYAAIYGGDYINPALPMGSFLCRGMGTEVTDQQELDALPWNPAQGIWKITGEQLGDLLETCFNTTLDKTEKQDMDSVYYREDTDTYYYRPIPVQIEKVWVTEGYRDTVNVIYLDVYVQPAGRAFPYWCRVVMVPDAQGQYHIHSVKDIPYKPAEPTDPTIEYKEALPEEITGTPLTEEELSAFTELFTREDGEDNCYNVLLASEFLRPVDINTRELFVGGLHPYLELTDADKAFLYSVWGYDPNEGGDVFKIPVSYMEEVLNNYLGVSLDNVNRHYLDSMAYFADGDCYFGGGGGALGADNFTMIDGKRQSDGTVWLLSRTPAKAQANTQSLKLLCLKPQPDNEIAPYRVESCQWLMYLGKDYPTEVDDNKYVPYLYTGSPVTIDGKLMGGHHNKNYLYAYHTETGEHLQISKAPIHSFSTGQDGYLYFVVEDQSQIVRYSYAGERMQLVYAPGAKINSVAYAGNNKLLVEEEDTSVLYDMTTGIPLRLPSVEQMNAVTNKGRNIFLFHYPPTGEVMDGGYEGQPYNTEGMQVGHVYIVEDGVNYDISGVPVSEDTADFTNGYVYFVREDDLKKVWRTDLRGQNLTLVYESQHGDITFLMQAAGRLGIIEDGKRAVYYEPATQKRTVLLEAYEIELFSYEPAFVKMYWRGRLNESDQPGLLGDDAYYYYFITDTYEIFDYTEGWIAVTPEQ